MPGGRSVFPFYVAEKVCGQRDLKTRRGQNNACAVNYELLKQNTVENGGNDVGVSTLAHSESEFVEHWGKLFLDF